jgi:hypothetical protein
MNFSQEILTPEKGLEQFKLYKVGDSDQRIIKDSRSGKFLSLHPDALTAKIEICHLFYSEIDRRNRKHRWVSILSYATIKA